MNTQDQPTTLVDAATHISPTQQFTDNAAALLTHPNAIFTTTFFALTALTPVAKTMKSPIQVVLLSLAGGYLVDIFTKEYVHPSINKWIPAVSLGMCAVGITQNLVNMAKGPISFPVTSALPTTSIEEKVRVAHTHQLAIGCLRTHEIPAMSRNSMLLNARAVDFYPSEMGKLLDIIARTTPNWEQFQAIVFHDKSRVLSVFHVPGYVPNSESLTLTLNVSGLL